MLLPKDFGIIGMCSASRMKVYLFTVESVFLLCIFLFLVLYEPNDNLVGFFFFC